MLALDDHENSLCACGCGFPREWTRDKANHFTFDVDTCEVGAAGAALMRKQQAADEQAEKTLKDRPGARRPSDGRSVAVRLMSEAEVAEARALRSTPPTPSTKRTRKRGVSR